MKLLFVPVWVQFMGHPFDNFELNEEKLASSAPWKIVLNVGRLLFVIGAVLLIHDWIYGN
jgi:hypothetical protein